MFQQQASLMSGGRLSLNTLIDAGLALYLILLVPGYFSVGAGVLFDSQTFALSLGLGLLVTIAHFVERDKHNPTMTMTVVIFLIYIFPRLLAYLYSPAIVEFPFGDGVGVEDINKGLFYILTGTVFMLGGMIFAARLWPVREAEFIATATRQMTSRRMLWIWAAVFFIELMMELYLTGWLGLSPYAVDKIREYDGHHLIQALRAIVGLDTTLLTFFTYLVLPGNWKAGRQQWIWVITLSLVFLTYTAYSGSRGGGLRLFMFAITVLLIWRARSAWALPRIAAFFLAIALMSTLSFSIGDYFRVREHQEHTLLYQAENKLMQGSGLPDNAAPAASVTPVTPVAAPVFIAFMDRIINRLGVLDYAILMTTQAPERTCKLRFMNMQYVVKNIVNSVLPGTIFPEAVLNTSRVVSICYRGMTTGEVLVAGYHSEFWTIWGLGLVMFGWWGGWVFMAVSGFLLYALYAVVWKFFPKEVRLYYAALYVFIVPLLTVLTMGLDHSVNTTIIIGAQLAVVLLLVKGVSMFFQMIRPIASIASSETGGGS